MLFGPDRPTDHKMISLLKEPQDPPIQKGPVTFCPEGKPGLLGIHQFRKEGNGIFTRYPIAKDIALYLYVAQLEISRMNGHSEYMTDYMMHMNIVSLPVRDSFLPPTELVHRDPMRPADQRSTGGIGYPWRGYHSLKEDAFGLADMALMTLGLKTKSNAPIPFASDLLFMANLFAHGLSIAAQERFKKQFGLKG
jgi:hypothetical protein